MGSRVSATPPMDLIQGGKPTDTMVLDVPMTKFPKKPTISCAQSSWIGVSGSLHSNFGSGSVSSTGTGRATGSERTLSLLSQFELFQPGTRHQPPVGWKNQTVFHVCPQRSTQKQIRESKLGHFPGKFDSSRETNKNHGLGHADCKIP